MAFVVPLQLITLSVLHLKHFEKILLGHLQSHKVLFFLGDALHDCLKASIVRLGHSPAR